MSVPEGFYTTKSDLEGYMTTDQLAAYLMSFPTGTPIYANDGPGDVAIDCEPIELFLPISRDANLDAVQYLVITKPLGRH
jgi:hypothetical protein